MRAFIRLVTGKNIQIRSFQLNSLTKKFCKVSSQVKWRLTCTDEMCIRDRYSVVKSYLSALKAGLLNYSLPWFFSLFWYKYYTTKTVANPENSFRSIWTIECPSGYAINRSFFCWNPTSNYQRSFFRLEWIRFQTSCYHQMWKLVHWIIQWYFRCASTPTS